MLCFPAVIAEHLPGHRSVRRAFQLAKTGRPRVIAVFALMGVAVMAVVVLYGSLAAVLDSGSILDALARPNMLYVVVTGLASPWFTAVVLLLYHDRRIRLEMIDSEGEQ